MDMLRDQAAVLPPIDLEADESESRGSANIRTAIFAMG
jgi:hypothetical protein